MGKGREGLCQLSGEFQGLFHMLFPLGKDGRLRHIFPLRAGDDVRFHAETPAPVFGELAVDCFCLFICRSRPALLCHCHKEAVGKAGENIILDHEIEAPDIGKGPEAGLGEVHVVVGQFPLVGQAVVGVDEKRIAEVRIGVEEFRFPVRKAGKELLQPFIIIYGLRPLSRVHIEAAEESAGFLQLAPGQVLDAAGIVAGHDQTAAGHHESVHALQAGFVALSGLKGQRMEGAGQENKVVLPLSVHGKLRGQGCPCIIQGLEKLRGIAVSGNQDPVS